MVRAHGFVQARNAPEEEGGGRGGWGGKALGLQGGAAGTRGNRRAVTATGAKKRIGHFPLNCARSFVLMLLGRVSFEFSPKRALKTLKHQHFGVKALVF